MKKIVYLIIFIIQFVNFSSVLAQTGIEWKACYGVAATGFLNDACETPDGGFIIVGEANPNDTVLWPNHMGGSDYGVIRIDSVGNIIWKKTYGGNKYDVAYSIIKGKRPNRYYIGGRTNSEGSTNYHAPNNTDAWIVAIDGAGTMLWDRCYGGYNGGEQFNSLVQLGDSNIIYGIGNTGSFNSGDVTGSYNATLTGWLCKINANTGMLIKQKIYGGTGSDYLIHSTVLNTSSFLVQGYTESRDHDVWVHYGNGPTNSNGWLLNIDTSLNIVWQKTIGTSSHGTINNVIKTQDGGFAVIGWTKNKPGDTSCFNFYVDTTVLANGEGKDEAFIIKYDSLGSELWQQHYSAPLDPVRVESAFMQMLDGNFVFTTVISQWNSFAPWPYKNGTVFFKTDSAGNFISTSRYGNKTPSSIQGIGVQPKRLFTTVDNKLIVVSQFAPYTGQSVNDNWCIWRIGHQLSIEDNIKTEPLIKVYPNPSNGIINIDFENTSGIKRISVYNTLGQLIENIAVNTNLTHYSFNLNANPKGLYFIGIETNNTLLFKKVILE
jgi:hypothetical protein